MTRPLATGIDPLSIAARSKEVVALVAAAKAVILSYHLDTDPETWIDRLAAALAPFEGGKEAGDG